MNRLTSHGKPCPYCQRLMDRGTFKLQPTRDHIVPQSRGGSARLICCLTCNGIKADMMPEAWAAYMAANPGWWLLSAAERRARARAGRRQYDMPNKNGNRIARQPRAMPVVVPPELIFTERKDQ